MMKRFLCVVAVASFVALGVYASPAGAGRAAVQVSSLYTAATCTVTATATTTANGPLWVNFAVMGTRSTYTVLASKTAAIPKGEDHATDTLTLQSGDQATLVYAYLYRGTLDGHMHDAMTYRSESVSYSC